MPDAAFHRMTLNAMRFLRLAVQDVANRPDQMAIRVYTAVELILKARLMHEHWSLIVTKNPDRAAFEAGDFVSVTFEEACKRLADAVRDPVPADTKAKFNELRKLRNLIVHFAPPPGDKLEQSTANQNAMRLTAMSAWGALHNLMGKEWKAYFEPYFGELDAIEKPFKQQAELQRILNNDVRGGEDV